MTTLWAGVTGGSEVRRRLRRSCLTNYSFTCLTMQIVCMIVKPIVEPPALSSPIGEYREGAWNERKNFCHACAPRDISKLKMAFTALHAFQTHIARQEAMDSTHGHRMCNVERCFFMTGSPQLQVASNPAVHMLFDHLKHFRTDLACLRAHDTGRTNTKQRT